MIDDAKWLKSLKPGDRVAYGCHNFSEVSHYNILTVKRATKTIIIVEINGDEVRFSRKDGLKIKTERGAWSNGECIVPVNGKVIEKNRLYVAKNKFKRSVNLLSKLQKTIFDHGVNEINSVTSEITKIINKYQEKQ